LILGICFEKTYVLLQSKAATNAKPIRDQIVRFRKKDTFFILSRQKLTDCKSMPDGTHSRLPNQYFKDQQLVFNPIAIICLWFKKKASRTSLEGKINGILMQKGQFNPIF